MVSIDRHIDMRITNHMIYLFYKITGKLRTKALISYLRTNGMTLPHMPFLDMHAQTLA